MGNAQSYAEKYIEYAERKNREREIKQVHDMVTSRNLSNMDLFSCEIVPPSIVYLGDDDGRKRSKDGIREVVMYISETFPDEKSLLGSVAIGVFVQNTHTHESEEMIPITCAGKPYDDVSRDVNLAVKKSCAEGKRCIIGVLVSPSKDKTQLEHQAYGTIDPGWKWLIGQGKRAKKPENAEQAQQYPVFAPVELASESTFFISPTPERGDRSVKNIVIAWCSFISGVTRKPIAGVPVIWRKTYTGPVTIRPVYRERRHGSEDDRMCEQDYSEESTTQSVILEYAKHIEEQKRMLASQKRNPSSKHSRRRRFIDDSKEEERHKSYDTLRRAPLPADGCLTVPGTSRPYHRGESPSNIRKVELVDVKICHPVIDTWVKKCIVTVSTVDSFMFGETTDTHIHESFDHLPNHSVERVPVIGSAIDGKFVPDTKQTMTFSREQPIASIERPFGVTSSSSSTSSTIVEYSVQEVQEESVDIKEDTEQSDMIEALTDLLGNEASSSKTRPPPPPPQSEKPWVTSLKSRKQRYGQKKGKGKEKQLHLRRTRRPPSKRRVSTMRARKRNSKSKMIIDSTTFENPKQSE